MIRDFVCETDAEDFMRIDQSAFDYVYEIKNKNGSFVYMPYSLEELEYLVAFVYVDEIGMVQGWMTYDKLGNPKKCKTKQKKYYYKVNEIAVHPSQHGKGIGSKLLKHLFNITDKQRSVCYVEVQYEAGKEPSNVRFYAKNGFKHTDPLELSFTKSDSSLGPIVTMIRE